MTKPAKVESRLITQYMNTAAKLKESKNSETKVTTQAPQDRMLERKLKGTQGANRAPCRKVPMRVIGMNQDRKQLIAQLERNNLCFSTTANQIKNKYKIVHNSVETTIFI